MNSYLPKHELRVGIDTGGTFTDIVLTNTATGKVEVTKVPSTPDNPAIALRRSIEKVFVSEHLDVNDLTSICHGTTVATNALLQGQIDNLALIVTRGFRHILEIARQAVPEGYGNSYFWVKPDRIVPVHRVFEIDERLDFRGNTLKKLDEDSVREVARKLKKYKLATAGVCLIHSYANPAHERRVREILTQEYPELVISISSDVWPEYREYERTVTTLVDAFVKPHMRRYLDRIEDELPEKLGNKPFLVMQSSGGVLSSRQVAKKPITTALSGPAAGVVGASIIGDLAGFKDVITLDAGGTSTDICLVEEMKPNITTGATVGAFPVRLPMIDIHTVGTGGGSIAWIGRDGSLQVGPTSAGAEPGPMCYPNGGNKPTITDANVVLGRLPSELIGGGIKLNTDRARYGIEELGKNLPKRLSVEELAEGIIEIANWSQANLIRQMTIRRGIDPRDFAIISFGGLGPTLSPEIMELLQLRACIIPPSPGNLSAFGLMMVDYRSDHVFTKVVSEEDLNPKEIAAIYESLESDARNTLMTDGVDEDDIQFVCEADIRYEGQSTEVRVSVPVGGMIDEIVENFHAAHEQAYGYCYRGSQKIELVNFALSGLGKVKKPDLKSTWGVKTIDAVEPTSIRQVVFGGIYNETPVYSRGSMAPGIQMQGPLVIEEFGSTTVIPPGQQMVVDNHGIMVVTRNGGPS